MTGANVNSFSQNGTLYTMLGYTGGHSFSGEISFPETDLRKLTVRMIMLLDALDDFHGEGYLHLDIAPDNILLIGSGIRERVMLIDYNSVHEADAVRLETPDAFSVKAGYTAPEIRAGNLAQIREASDLYSVVAVFFRCLSGSALTPFQMIRPVPPDVSSCPALVGKPETVCTMVRQILRRGLQNLSVRRYATISELSQAFQELLDRIDGVGVTHWALWEAARKNLQRTLRNNPAFNYIREDEDLFPVSVALPDRSKLSLDAYIERILSDCGISGFLTGAGGMGKTTALLRTVYLWTQRYNAKETAVAYVPLYGCKEHDTDYISNQLLLDLRFKEDTQSYGAARIRLWQLLDKPLRTRNGERPVLLLLLDGLNEVTCPTTNLLEEIRKLSRLQGVRILISSRIAVPDLSMETAELTSLQEEEVIRRITQAGLLAPEAEEIRTLLRTPMMLSLFLRASHAEEKQLAVHTQEELIATYFQAIKDKALRDFPENDPARWQLDASVSMVLPALAGLLQKSPDAAEEELLRETSRCYRLLSDRLLLRAFPQWIGHRQSIRGSAANAEEWYGSVVHDLLWKRLGLLIRTEKGSYRIPHEILLDYLAQQHRDNIEKLKKQRRLRGGIILLTLLLVLGLSARIYVRYFRPQPYDDGDAESVMAISLDAYHAAGNQYENLRELLESAEREPEDIQSAFATYQYRAAVEDATPRVYIAFPDNQLEITLATGSVVSWSGNPLDEEYYPQLVKLAENRKSDYKTYAEFLVTVTEDSAAHKYAAQYREALNTLLEKDADIAAVLYQLVCVPHMTSDFMTKTETGKAFTRAYTENNIQNEHIKDEPRDTLVRKLKELEKGQKDAVDEIVAVIDKYQRIKGGHT